MRWLAYTKTRGMKWMVLDVAIGERDRTGSSTWPTTPALARSTASPCRGTGTCSTSPGARDGGLVVEPLLQAECWIKHESLSDRIDSKMTKI